MNASRACRASKPPCRTFVHTRCAGGQESGDACGLAPSPTSTWPGIVSKLTIGPMMTLDAALRSAPPADPRTMSGVEFEAALLELAAGARTGNIGCIDCEGCERCRDCTFCVDSTRLARCHYTVGCHGCVDCAHCSRCHDCSACQHCILSEACVGSAYLVRSTGCSGCTYCFGCVGLTRRDFCILNEPYDRATYFDLTVRLARELRIAMP
jgi:hypothetical protein